MIDLHLHLDGSLSEQDFVYLAKKENVSLGDSFPSNIYVPSDCPSLAVYLERFALPIALMQSEENLAYVTKSLVERLYLLGFIYTEIRFAPQLHTQKGLNQLQVTKAALKGLKQGLKDKKDFDANLILCCMRHADEKINMETIEVANILKEHKVVAVDLAGDETLHPASYYSSIFSKAKEYGLNITIHGGEATGNDEILMAIDNGATRIGHGVHLSLDKKNVELIKKANILFEICPTSNTQTKSIPTIEESPIRKFLENNIPFCINSDNMTVSNTDAFKEYKVCRKAFSLNNDEIKKILFTAIEHSFTTNHQKEIMKECLENKFPEFLKRIS